ncbi:retrovirus-related pol polyprotein from transposon TNT 1-94 [Tanacetum coccineum]
MQINQEIFQKNSVSNNQIALEIPESFENNDLKAQLQAKDTTVGKLKEHIKFMRENDKEEKVKHEMDEIETINIELEHSVAKLLSENERLHKEIKHLKNIYKDQFDLIKKTRALFKEHGDSLITQLNSKSLENADLKRQIQDNVFVITSLKNDLRKLKGKEVENVAKIPIATTVAPGMFKLDLNPLAPSDKKVAITPMNKVKKVRFSEPLTSSSNIKQIVLWYLDSGCSKHMTRNHSQLMNIVSKFLGTVRFKNDQVAKIMRYVDYQLAKDFTICPLSKSIRRLESWLWHRWLSHLNFDTLNKLAKDGLARGIPKLKFQKDHLCLASALGKSKKSSHQHKAKDTNQEKLYLLHMDLYGPMRMESINGKKYFLVIFDDYS